MHYRPATDGEGVVSDADDPRFFLAPTGKTDPRAELAATLRAFFSADRVGGDPQPAQCAFIARYRWLKGELSFDDRRLRPHDCARFQQWFHALNAEAATLVFASAYLNNPASLFGHTLLRLDQRGQTDQTRLLAYAINYAADDTDANALMYVLDGVSGGFKGRFDIQPYYKLVRAYSDLESRDLWEYRLNLSGSQLQRLLEHVWELRGIEFDYYFFRENCAWQLLTLLEAADPELRLSDEYLLWTLPADTIRLLARQPGLVGAVTARPARGTSINRRYEALTAGERQLARRLRNDPAVIDAPDFAGLAPERQALLLELALDERQHRRADKTRPTTGTIAPPDAIAHRWLTARTRLSVAAAPVAVEPYATRPETGRASRRMGVGIGQRDGASFVELDARASYHDLLEPDIGYTPNAQIELLSIALRHYPDRDGLKLDRLTLLDITSLPPVDALTPRPAWRIHAGWEAVPQPDCLMCMAFNLGGGLGLAAETGWPWRTVWFALPGLEFDASDEFTAGYRAGLALTAGALLEPAAGWKVLASATWLDYRLGETGSAARAAVRQHWALNRDLSLGMDWRHWEGIHEFEIGLRVYF
ncbi:MAG: DUF4105 domain-containing protein [Candidatus Contendobacter sp.]|nr:DUF4105 domain-containing protein [Candidatus Contendobacter sp.]MDG4557979.1 DUF4105 domain-containing protein [Candidatus Contendobacter sp.]